jgi:hypothetical protein
MARGFESKDVEFQQAEKDRAKQTGPVLTDAERRVADRRRTTELAWLRAKADLNAATSPGHRRMLQSAIAALEAELTTADRR